MNRPAFIRAAITAVETMPIPRVGNAELATMPPMAVSVGRTEVIVQRSASRASWVVGLQRHFDGEPKICTMLVDWEPGKPVVDQARIADDFHIMLDGIEEAAGMEIPHPAR